MDVLEQYRAVPVGFNLTEIFILFYFILVLFLHTQSLFILFYLISFLVISGTDSCHRARDMSHLFHRQG